MVYNQLSIDNLNYIIGFVLEKSYYWLDFCYQFEWGAI
jgi:hypothetical protein